MYQVGISRLFVSGDSSDDKDSKDAEAKGLNCPNPERHRINLK